MRCIPFVSICIPAFNAELFIEETLESVLRQDYPQLEILVSDDCSTDGTLQLIERCNDSRLIIIRQKKNLGNYANCNAVVRAARGELICKVDADDLLEPNFVSEMVSALLEHPEAVVAYCAMRLINQSGRYICYERKITGSELRIGPEEYIRQVVSFNGHGGCILFKREAFEIVGGYNEKFLHTAGDWVLFREFAKLGGIYYLDKVLASYRIHSVNKEKRKMYRVIGYLDHLEDIINTWPPNLAGKEDVVKIARKQWSNDLLWSYALTIDKNELPKVINIIQKLHRSHYNSFLIFFIKKGGRGFLFFLKQSKNLIRQKIKLLIFLLRLIPKSGK